MKNKDLRLPYSVEDHPTSDTIYYLNDAHGEEVATFYFDDNGLKARHVMRAVNSHDKLVKALEVMTSLTRVKYGNMDAHVYAEILKAIEALAAAKGE